MKRFNPVVAYIAAFAAKMVGQQTSEDKSAEPTKVTGKAYRRKHKRTNVFGETPPTPDPGGVHAYMRRHRA